MFLANLQALTYAQRLDALLARGTLPKEVPYCFTMRGLADVAAPLASAWQGKKITPGKYEVITAPRAGPKRRWLAVPNPVHHVLLCHEIATSWPDIAKHTKISEDISTYNSAIFRRAERAIREFDFDAFADAKSMILANYGRALKTDIQRFYGSIYTHSIPWALHTKAVAKSSIKNLKKPGGMMLGDRLDALVRNGQDGQTIGLPIGPDSSRIIAEIVAVGIDQELEKTFTPLNGRYYRNVDDLVLGLRRRENAASCLSSVAEAFSKFELEFNSEKTRELGADEPLRSLWVQYLGEIENASNVAKQGVSIRRFFEGMFELQRDHPTDNVVRYAIAKASSVAIASENWSVFQQFLIRAARAQSSILDLVALLTFEAVQYKKPVDKAAVLELVGDLVEESVPTGRDYELMWALLICRELNLALGKDLCGAIQRSSCSLAIIIALDLERRGLAKFADKSFWQSLVYGEGLWSRSWMLAYESRVRSWLKPKKSGKWAVKEAYFVDLAKKKVRFSSPTMNPVRLGGLRKALAEQALFGSY